MKPNRAVAQVKASLKMIALHSRSVIIWSDSWTMTSLWLRDMGNWSIYRRKFPSPQYWRIMWNITRLRRSVIRLWRQAAHEGGIVRPKRRNEKKILIKLEIGLFNSFFGNHKKLGIRSLDIIIFYFQYKSAQRSSRRYPYLLRFPT